VPPVYDLAAGLVLDGEVGQTSIAIGPAELALVFVRHAERMQNVRHDYLGLGTDGFTANSLVGLAFLEKTILDGNGLRRNEQVGKPARSFGVIGLAVLPELGEIALVEDDPAVALAGERGVEQFRGKQPTRIGQHDEGDVELAALGLWTVSACTPTGSRRSSCREVDDDLVHVGPTNALADCANLV
jgi:hypothetical protein